MKAVVINLAVVVGLIVMIEGGSWAAINAYQWARSGTKDAAGVEFVPKAVEKTGDDPTSKWSGPGVKEDLEWNASMPGSPFRYESYVVYRNRPFASGHVNIAPDGMRYNAKPPIKPPTDRGGPVKVWMFGSSAPWGATNGDNETIAAYLEQALSRELGPVSVSNFSVVGYTSWQELLAFHVRLIERSPPDLVLFFNGLNDHYRGWLNETPQCEMLFHTAVGSSEALEHAWESRSAKGFIDWPVIQSMVASWFRNTIELARLTRKYFDLRAANRDVPAWRDAYRTRVAAVARAADACVPRAQDIYLRNMGLAARLATDNGIKVALVQQPMLYATQKPLVGPERSESEHPNYTTFAMEDSELAAVAQVPTYRIDQQHVWNRKKFVETYRVQKDRLAALARKRGALSIDVEPAINSAGEVAVYSSGAHFTFRGARLVAETLAPQIADALKGTR